MKKRICNSTPLLCNLNEKEKEKLCEHLNFETIENDKQIIKEGEQINKFYIIQEGGVRVLQRSKDGKEITSKELYSGDYFGEDSLGNRPVSSINVTSISRLTALTITRQEFIDNIGTWDKIYERKLVEDCFKNTPFLVKLKLSANQLYALLTEGKIVNFKDKEVIINKGDTSSIFY